MIKIQEHLNRPDSDDYLDTLAIKMWNYLNQKNKGGDFNKYSLINKLDRLKLLTTTADYQVNYAENEKLQVIRHQEFINYLQNNNHKKLINLITARPNELYNLKSEILNILNQEDLTFTKGNKIEQTAFGKLLISNLFNYKSFRQSQLCYQLIIDADLQYATCPYCNENHISVIDISDETEEAILNKAYLDLDHFYPKSQHPYFALSYYNLVPCCHACNSREKGDKEFCIQTHQHPFYESFNENYTFEINPNTFIDGATDKLILKNVASRIDYSDRDLRLSSRYVKYLDEINIFVSHYLNYYNSNPPYNLDWKEAVLKDVPLEVHEILGKRIGKMYRDIFKQIDIDDLVQD